MSGRNFRNILSSSNSVLVLCTAVIQIYIPTAYVYVVKTFENDSRVVVAPTCSVVVVVGHGPIRPGRVFWKAPRDKYLWIKKYRDRVEESLAFIAQQNLTSLSDLTAVYYEQNYITKIFNYFFFLYVRFVVDATIIKKMLLSILSTQINY